MSQFGDSLLEAWRNVWSVVRVHDEPAPGEWLCGHCPYPNVGPICTKCGAPRCDGMEVNRA